MSCEVWWAVTGRLAWQRLAGVLDPGERARLDALRRDEDRERFVLAAALARACVADRLRVAPPSVRLDRRCARCGEPHGQPRVAAPAAALHLSITHSGRLVGVALAGDPVGIDVEALDGAERSPDVARAVLVDAERAALARTAPGGAPDRQRVTAFLRYWTRKEALAKMVGRGLDLPLSALEVSGPDEQARLVRWEGRDDLVGRVALHDLDPPHPRHVAAVALRHRGARPAERDGLALLAASSAA